jgi:RNA polymerase sigma factor (sigma-70 family)
VLHRPDFDPSRPDAVGYLKQAALWRLRDERRRSAHQPGPLPAQLLDPSANDPHQALEREETRERVRRGVDRLPEEQWAVLVRRLSGMGHEQTAADLGVPIAVVYRRFHEANAALRRILEGDARTGLRGGRR